MKTSGQRIHTMHSCVLLLCSNKRQLGIDKIETALTSVQVALGLYLLSILERLQICGSITTHVVW
jgi:hypothetical protein